MVLDLCTGSGCIAISIAREKREAKVLAVEKYDEALRYAKENAKINGTQNVGFIKGDVFESAASDVQYALIVSNPPYIPPNEMKETSPEVSFEPETALLGGEDGLDFYRMMLRIWSTKLKQGGLFAVEIGIGQENDVMRIFEENGIKAAAQKDYCGIYRVVYGIK